MKKLIILPFIFLFQLVTANILDYTRFHTPAEVDAALTTFASMYPSLARVVILGNSLEGRPIKALKISNNPAVNDPAKGDIVYVSLHHAREWISVEMALYLADELLARYSTDAVLQAEMNNLQIWIIPVVNPDGYQYTQTSANRYWRKNRRNNGDGTFGVDLNRNWGYQWGLLSGSSASTSNDTYHGTGPFSEPELVVLRNFINGLTNFKSFVSYHSFSELYLRPWSYTTSNPPGETTLQSIVQRNISRIAAVHSHTYAETIGYTSAGEATDYIWQEKRVAGFTPELRPSAAGVGGFDPPPSEIIPCCEENYAAARALIHDAAITGLWIKDNPWDTGAEPSTGEFWISPDIWTDPVDLVEGTTVTLHIRVRNSTTATQNNVRVAAYYTDPRIALEFPSTTSTLIGTQNISVPVGASEITMPWTVPSGRNSWGELHWCVGVVIKQEDDMPLTTLINRTSNIACRNFDTREAISGMTLTVAATNFLTIAAELQLNFSHTKLPAGWRYEVMQNAIKRDKESNPGTLRKGKLLHTKGILLEPGETIQIPLKVYFDRPSATPVDLKIQGDLIPMVAGKRDVLSNGYSFQLKPGN
ncbi:MAG: M14 family metallopeptidase [Ginsengibacter sp.]